MLPAIGLEWEGEPAGLGSQPGLTPRAYPGMHWGRAWALPSLQVP